MKIASDCHLTYCTNIHPGEDWPTLFSNLQTHLPHIKQAVSPKADFGVGLRLSAKAASFLNSNNTALTECKQWLASEGLYVFTLNGFPYGTFHQAPVKERVYQPDWQTQERLTYSSDLAQLLTELLPDGLTGSISTVPVGFARDFVSPKNIQRAANTLLQFTCFLVELKAKTGKTIQLALEPEPGCLLETTQGAIDFFDQYLFSEAAVEQLNADAPQPVTLATIKQHLGLCLDTCHSAVMFEKATDSALQILAAGIPIHKIQLTAALQVSSLNKNIRNQLRPFVDSVYLHQTSVLEPGATHSQLYLDLPEALDCAKDGSALRSHFHVPLFYSAVKDLQTTQEDLIALLQHHSDTPLSQHLEVETYTFDVLPETLKTATVREAISRELLWVKGLLKGKVQ